jgi:hypothetical protein
LTTLGGGTEQGEQEQEERREGDGAGEGQAQAEIRITIMIMSKIGREGCIYPPISRGLTCICSGDRRTG